MSQGSESSESFDSYFEMVQTRKKLPHSLQESLTASFAKIPVSSFPPVPGGKSDHPSSSSSSLSSPSYTAIFNSFFDIFKLAPTLTSTISLQLLRYFPTHPSSMHSKSSPNPTFSPPPLWTPRPGTLWIGENDT